MSLARWTKRAGPALAPLAAVGALWIAADAGAARGVRGCGAFSSQAAAQAYFVARGGAPKHRVGGLDPDRDGVACEFLSGPYAGYATIGFSASKRFFFGSVTMPPGGAGESGFPCLEGNPHFTDGPRTLSVYRVGGRRDRRVTPEIGAEARPANGRLVWKSKAKKLHPGLYYVAFTERQRMHPFGANECPGFASAPRRLPRPR